MQAIQYLPCDPMLLERLRCLDATSMSSTTGSTIGGDTSSADGGGENGADFVLRELMDPENPYRLMYTLQVRKKGNRLKLST